MSTNKGFNIILPSCITKEGVGWKYNKSEHVFITQHQLHGSLAPSYNALSTCIALYLPCFVSPKHKNQKNHHS